MAKNLIPQIARMLGVKIDEKFKIKGCDGLTYQLENDRLTLICDDTKTFYVAADTFVALLRGDAEIIKLPWQPKKGDVFYSFYMVQRDSPSPIGYTGDRCDYVWKVTKFCWGSNNSPFMFALLKAGWVFRTKEEAEIALPKVAAEMGVEYEI